MDMSFIAPYFHVSPEFHVWSVQLGVIVLATICCNLLLLRLLSFLAQLAQKTSSLWQGAVMQAARVPMSFMVWLCGISVAMVLLRAVVPARSFVYMGELRSVLLVAIAALFVIRLIGNMEARLLKPQNDGKPPVDITTARAISKLLRLLVFVLAALMALQTLGVSISGVLAFGGVGAMAIGFAAKDLLANFFGGLMIYMDRPLAWATTSVPAQPAALTGWWKISVGASPAFATTKSGPCTFPTPCSAARWWRTFRVCRTATSMKRWAFAMTMLPKWRPFATMCATCCMPIRTSTAGKGWW